MSGALVDSNNGAGREQRRPVELGVSDWLNLAASPTFAAMGLLTGAMGGGMPALLCSTGQGATPLCGMAPMYLLMSGFHLAPWLKLISGRSGDARRV